MPACLPAVGVYLPPRNQKITSNRKVSQPAALRFRSCSSLYACLLACKPACLHTYSVSRRRRRRRVLLLTPSLQFIHPIHASKLHSIRKRHVITRLVVLLQLQHDVLRDSHPRLLLTMKISVPLFQPAEHLIRLFRFSPAFIVQHGIG